ncbi:Serpin family [Corchorus olitorius]|uniref:Serpin family n=1 Tax=Corchorus olitorius TaxID=93759 RepID=A0A1R3HIC1_9ROSI|nr:Serpin family [Corchorus olitorius]
MDDKRRFFMYIFLPHERNGLKKSIDNFDSTLNTKFELHQCCVHNLKIPKFKFLCGFSASKHMDKLGFGTPSLSSLEMLEANVNADEDRDIGAFHRSFVEVNEEGTEAAAVESDEDTGCSLEDVYRPRKVINFIADHPFMFMVKEDASNVPLFIGAVINPLLD